MPKASEKNLLVHFYAEPIGKKRLCGDPVRLRQIFENLLSNAVKFTKSGIIRLKAVVKNTTEDSVTMSFEVKDSGIGISDEQIKKIFEQFMQAETGTTREYGGTGLGLSIVKNIIELLGGTLKVESEVGKGSSFSFELTFDAYDIEEEENPEDGKPVENVSKPTFEGEVLLCEDNLMNQQLVSEHLNRVGLKTTIAQNGSIGVKKVYERLGNKQFDIIFMDIHMPVMDGLEAAKKIIDIAPEIPVVAMTANILKDDRDVYSAVGMVDCIGKPFTAQELWRCLMKHLNPVSVRSGYEKNDVDEALRRRLISIFVSINKDRFATLDGALKNGDTKLAHLLAHTLKSNAAQLEKFALQKVAEEVERAIVEDKVTPQMLKVLETELNAVLAEFEPLVSEIAYKEAETSDENPDILINLKSLLENGDVDCMKLIPALKRMKGTEKLVGLMESFDFRPALSELEQLSEVLKKGGSQKRTADFS